jgi:hypothetical protein
VAILENSLKKREVEMSLVFKMTFQCLFFLPEIITGASLDIDEDSG